MFKANATSDFHLAVQIKKLSLNKNKIGNSGEKALATCLWNIDELDLCVVTSQNVRNCAMLFKVWKDR